MGKQVQSFEVARNLGINYIPCCKIVLMQHNELCKISFLPFSANMNFTRCCTSGTGI